MTSLFQAAAELPADSRGRSYLYEQMYATSAKDGDAAHAVDLARGAASALALEAARALLPSDLHPEGRVGVARALALESRRWAVVAETHVLCEYVTVYCPADERDEMGETVEFYPVLRGPKGQSLLDETVAYSRSRGGARLAIVTDDGTRLQFVSCMPHLLGHARVVCIESA